jgi:hypothetical protein
MKEMLRAFVRLLLSAACLALLAPGSLAAPAARAGVALIPPVPLAPADGTVTTVADYPPLGIPEFSWLPSPGATSYRLQFSQDVAFTTKVEFTTANARYTPADATKFPDGVWYWRVRADAPSPASDYSATLSFTKQWATPDNLPLLVAPAADATLDFYDHPTFSWQPVMGAAYYRFQIAASPDGFATPRYSQTTLATAHQPTTKLANGIYYWRVVPLDPGGRDGTPSEAWPFAISYNQAPALLEPADGDTPTFTPTFRWTAVRGAQFYRLQYATDPTFNTGVTTVDTRNSTYTPTNNLPNDVNYYWRVRVHSGNSITDWSETRSFVKRWYLPPQLLTPVNNYQYVKDPFFSWTPVAGAAYYKLEVNNAPNFPPGSNGWTATTAKTFYVKPDFDKLPNSATWYWRVTPADRHNYLGQPSEVFSFGYRPNAQAPHLICPQYYYQLAADLQPHEDRTVPLPVFTWHRVTFSSAQAAAYRVQVSTDPLFGSINWTLDTQNLSAAPTTAAPFAPATSTDYFWRVRPLDALGGNELGQWSQIWKARFNVAGAGLLTVSPTGPVGPSPGLVRPGRGWPTGQGDRPEQGACHAERVDQPEPATARSQRSVSACAAGDASLGSLAQPPVGDLRHDKEALASAPELLRPAHAAEFVETTPLLEWWPLAGADSYSVQISSDPGFNPAYIVNSAVVPYPVYVPLARLSYGTYYWRVQGRSQGLPLGDWSAPWRFQVAAQSHWQEPRNLGNSVNRSLIGFDPSGDMSDRNYDLTTLYAVQSKDYWFFGFNAYTAPTNMVYGLYLDLDHTDDSGATTDPRGYSIATIAAHRPEYAIYVPQGGGMFSAGSVTLYRWTGIAWATPQTLDAIGGDLFYDPAANYVEIRVPNTAIGMQEATGSVALALFTAFTAGGHAQDTVPSDPNVAYPAPDHGAGTTTLSRFASVSERITTAWPPTSVTGDPTTFAAVPAFFWQLPVDVPWHGYNFQVAVDPNFTSWILDYTVRYNVAGYAPATYTPANDLNGDNSYYWRVRPVYDSAGNFKGAWSQPGRFERQGFQPEQLGTSVTFATPTFSWAMAEGAESYDLQVDDDPGFSSPAVSVTTSRASYTPTGTLAKGSYSWRVRVRRNGNVANDWTAPQTFTLDVPEPTGQKHAPEGVVDRAPTLCWDPLLAPAAGNPVLTAWKYRVQVSRDPSFSTIYDTADTEQICWTPTKGYDDGGYYWRLAMIDGDNRLGDYTAPAGLTKQYPVTTLITPTNGVRVLWTPTFVWTPVDGASSYKLEVSLYPSFSPLYDSVTTHNTRYTPIKKYDNRRTYYWRVAMADKDGKAGPFTGDTVLVYRYDSYLPLTEKAISGMGYSLP